jgi:hypothetical protein
MISFYIDQEVRLLPKKWSAGSGKDYFLDPVTAFPYQALKYG